MIIPVTRMNGSRFYLHPLHIETVEANPDTVITLTNGHKYVVRETPESIAVLMVDAERGKGMSPNAGGSVE